MNDTYVTLQGWVGNEVESREVGDTACVSFRVGCTPRYLKSGVWVDGTTSWYTVSCWRGLGRNVHESVRKGDAVIVHGRVRVDVWEREGQPPSVSWLVDATFVGHDLTRGTSSFAKATRTSVPEPGMDEGVRELVHSYDASGPRLDAEGNVLPALGREPAA